MMSKTIGSDLAFLLLCFLLAPTDPTTYLVHGYKSPSLFISCSKLSPPGLRWGYRAIQHIRISDSSIASHRLPRSGLGFSLRLHRREIWRPRISVSELWADTRGQTGSDDDPGLLEESRPDDGATDAAGAARTREQRPPDAAPQTSERSFTSEQSNKPLREPSLPDMMRIMGTSPRRIFLSIGSASAIALSANFLGVTSGILSALPEEFSERTGLDYVYPRGDYKHVAVRSGSCKCSFVIPKEWVADTGLALAQAQRQAGALDYSMANRGNASAKSGTLPDAAYGPPGKLDSRGLSNGDTNVSVIINNGLRNFSLARTLGSDPNEAAMTLLSKMFGPQRKITVFSAREERRGKDGILLYQFEYQVDRGDKANPLRAISVVSGSRGGDAFVTLTVVSPAIEWEDPGTEGSLRRVAESFILA